MLLIICYSFFCNDRLGPVIEFVYLYLCIFQHWHFGSKGRNEALHVMSPACEVTTTCKLGQRNTNRGLTPQQQEEKYLKSLLKYFRIFPTMSYPPSKHGSMYENLFLQYFLNMWFNVSSIFPAISCCLQNLDLCKITGFLNFSSKEPPSPSPTIRLSPINPQHYDTPRIYLKRMYIELKHCIVVEISTENKFDIPSYFLTQWKMWNSFPPQIP